MTGLIGSLHKPSARYRMAVALLSSGNRVDISADWNNFAESCSAA
ncbi:hypothetical protein [Thalassococcus sp. BH17M4-6]